MSLEQIVKTYGWVDYYDQHTGYIFCLSSPSVFLQRELGEQIIDVPVTDTNGNLVGSATMKNVA